MVRCIPSRVIAEGIKKSMLNESASENSPKDNYPYADILSDAKGIKAYPDVFA